MAIFLVPQTVLILFTVFVNLNFDSLKRMKLHFNVFPLF